MRSRATTLLFGVLLLALASPVLAQPVRTFDVAWARDVAGADLTLDGMLDEAVWQEADSVQLTWNNDTFYAPGGGWDDFFGNFDVIDEPTDPVDATVRLLRDGDILWFGVTVRDKSIGGSATDFWTNDGFWFQIVDKTSRPDTLAQQVNNFNGAFTDEFFYNWLDSYDVDGLPILHGNNADDRSIWDGMTVVDGTSNDDTNGDDTGYTMEVWVDLSMLGYDLSQETRVPMTFSVYDYDYEWPADPDKKFLSRAWWQNPWGADMPLGVGYVYTSPSVTVNSGDAPQIDTPDLIIPNAPNASINVDGQLDEPVWDQVDPQVSLQYQMTPEAMDALPGLGPYYTHWYRPGGDAEDAPPVVDPSIGNITYFFEGTTLYIGLDSDDQAISGDPSEDRSDGLGVTIRTRTSNSDGLQYGGYWYRVSIDSSGAAMLQTVPDTVDVSGVEAAVFLKGSSTAADPSDIDEGYQIEIAIDLTTVPGYEDGLEDNIIWVGANYFDGDYLDPIDQSYGMRTWWLTERNTGPTARAYLDEDFRVAVEDGAEVPDAIALMGNYPNPFNPVTTLRYALPQTGRVAVQIFDVLGRRVMTLSPGVQSAGLNELAVDAASLASGVYLYRVEVTSQASGSRTISHVGRMMLVK